MEKPLNWPHQRTLYSQEPAGAENSELVVSISKYVKYSFAPKMPQFALHKKVIFMLFHAEKYIVVHNLELLP